MTTPFRLETVRRVRHLEERAAGAKFAQMLAAARVADDALQHAVLRAHEAVPPRSTTRAGLTLALIRGLACAAETDAARAHALAAHRDAQAQRDAWQIAGQRSTGLARLKERHSIAAARAAARSEERELDDFIARQHTVRGQMSPLACWEPVA